MTIKVSQWIITILLLVTILIIALFALSINTPEKIIAPEPEMFSNTLIASFPHSERDTFLRNSSIAELFARPIHRYDPAIHCFSYTVPRPVCKCPYGSIEYGSEPGFNPPLGGECLPPLCLYVKSYSYAGDPEYDQLIVPNYIACVTAVFLDRPSLCGGLPSNERDYCYLSLKHYTGNASFCGYVNSTDYKQLCTGEQHD
ncbi:MAG: hypothetical protein AABX47_00140 [Nanoarchaeota archaeon]